MKEEIIIKKQLEFVKWLKAKGIYNRFDSAMVMQGKMEVWEHAITKTEEAKLCQT